MDYLTMLKNEELIEFVDNLSYQTNFIGDKLMPNVKRGNLKVAMRSIMEGGNLPVMAQVHAFDTEARIGDRPSFEEIKFEKLLIKEKLNQTERMAEYIDDGASASEIKNFVFDDAANLVSRVLTRMEVAKMEYLATGKITVKENNVTTTIDYHVPAANKVSLTGVGTGGALAAIEGVKAAAQKKGVNIVRAVCGSAFITELAKDESITKFWTGVTTPLTEKNLRAWINDNFGIEFVVNDDVYKTAATATTTHRFFDEKVVAFLGTKGTVGNGVFGVTPEERRLRNGNTSERALVTVTQWLNEDPVAVWTKASAVALPIPKDPNGLFIGTWK